MKCPYCGNEMQVGFIGLGKGSLVWTPDGCKKSIIINNPYDYEIVLARLNYLKGCKSKVYRCSDCKIQIIDEKDKTI